MSAAAVLTRLPCSGMWRPWTTSDDSAPPAANPLNFTTTNTDEGNNAIEETEKQYQHDRSPVRHDKIAEHLTTPAPAYSANIFESPSLSFLAEVESPSGPKCAHCGITASSLWRRSRNRELVCNPCGLYERVHGVRRPQEMNHKMKLKRQKRKGRVVDKKKQASSTSHANDDMISAVRNTAADTSGSITVKKTVSDKGINITTMKPFGSVESMNAFTSTDSTSSITSTPSNILLSSGSSSTTAQTDVSPFISSPTTSNSSNRALSVSSTFATSSQLSSSSTRHTASSSNYRNLTGLDYRTTIPVVPRPPHLPMYDSIPHQPVHHGNRSPGYSFHDVPSSYARHWSHPGSVMPGPRHLIRAVVSTPDSHANLPHDSMITSSRSSDNDVSQSYSYSPREHHDRSLLVNLANGQQLQSPPNLRTDITRPPS